MQVSLTAADLVAFEQEIADLFAAKKIRSPVHLESGSEEHLISVFAEHVNPEDWLCLSWRSHLKCLLKGVPREQVKQAILEGRSIALCFPEYRIVSSAIVGGVAPIAVGLALAIKRKGERRKVVCFIGDMTAKCGIVHECIEYARNHALPILFIVEDNGVSVGTPTADAWGYALENGVTHDVLNNVIRYRYKSKWPHVGCGKFIEF